MTSPQPINEDGPVTPADIVERIVEGLRHHAVGNNQMEYGRGWNCGLEEAEAIVRRIIEPALKTQAAEIAIIKTHSEKLARACEERDAEIARKDAALERAQAMLEHVRPDVDSTMQAVVTENDIEAVREEIGAALSPAPHAQDKGDGE